MVTASLDVLSLDARIGRSVKNYRLYRGLSQKNLAVSIGVTPQQLHKYEHGRNRICAGRLYALASVLSVPVYLFFPFEMDDAYEMETDASDAFPSASSDYSGYVLQEESAPYFSSEKAPVGDLPEETKQQRKEETILALAMDLEPKRLSKVVRILSVLLKEDGETSPKKV